MRPGWDACGQWRSARAGLPIDAGCDRLQLRRKRCRLERTGVVGTLCAQLLCIRGVAAARYPNKIQLGESPKYLATNPELER